MKAEIRNQKSERNPKPEVIRESEFGFASGFGFRVSDFDSNILQARPLSPRVF